MKKAIIRKGNHRPLIPTVGLVFKGETCYDYRFTPSCVYNRGDADQYDINKLHGIGYFPNHHIDSARAGWRWSTEKECIELFGYCYVDRKRVIMPLADVQIGSLVRVRVIADLGFYRFELINFSYNTYNQVTISNFRDKVDFGYKLGIYVGGGDKSGKDDTAMHDTVIEYRKV